VPNKNNVTSIWRIKEIKDENQKYIKLVDNWMKYNEEPVLLFYL
jgi:hypothetical protein